MPASDDGPSPQIALHELHDGATHIWAIPLSTRIPDAADWDILSPVEQERARRFHFDEHRHPYVLTHAAMRRILSDYTSISPEQIEYSAGGAGKPAIASPANWRDIRFNLSHSGEFALLAVVRGREVGVDVERWDERVEFLDVAEHYFSPGERVALRDLAPAPRALMQGFFQAWSRKEAYLKATGVGITRGLHHFDVALAPGQPAALLADRTDASATTRWSMRDLPMPAGYSAALVIEGSCNDIVHAKYRWA